MCVGQENHYAPLHTHNHIHFTHLYPHPLHTSHHIPLFTHPHPHPLHTGEELLVEIATCLKQCKQEQLDRDATLFRLATTVKGVYVPQFYERYEGCVCLGGEDGGCVYGWVGVWWVGVCCGGGWSCEEHGHEEHGHV